MIKLFLLILVSFSIFSNEEIEEVITTGTLLKESESKFSPVEIVTAEKFDEIGVSTIAEISKYLSASSGSHFQTNTMDGVDQGMSAITLRGLDHASTFPDICWTSGRSSCHLVACEDILRRVKT